MNNNNQILNQIALAIDQHRIFENKMYANNPAIGLANVHYFGQNRKLWITNNENFSGIKIISGLDKRPIISSSHHTTLIDDGQPVYKNTKVGECIIRHSSGIHKLQTPSGKHDIEIFNNSFYTPTPPPYLACDLRINLNEVKPRYYRYLSDVLKQIRDLNNEIEELERQKEIEEQRIQKQKEKEESQKLKEIILHLENSHRNKVVALQKAQTFIRKNAELRYQPILDPWQEEIKRSNIYNGTISIDGGPGTGKTTSLIQRIKFLIDEVAMSEYLPELTAQQKEKIFDQGKSWIFFSPSELLKLFLKNSMISEGLEANDDKVKVWADYKNILIRKYKIVNTETQNPFLFLRKNQEKNLLPYNGKHLKEIINSFENYYLDHQNNKLQKLIRLNISEFSWKARGLSIQNYIKRQDKDYSHEGLIRLYFNIQDNFTSEVKDISIEFDKLLKEGAAKVKLELEKNPDLMQKLKDVISHWETDTKDDEEDIEITDISEIEENELDNKYIDFEQILFRGIKSLIRRQALMKYDKNQRLNTKDKELNHEIIKAIDIQNLQSFDKIGQLAYFIKYFERSTKGVISNLISEIPMLYKAFRKKENKEKKHKWNFEILNQIVEQETDRNKRLHPEEQAFIILFVNNLINKTYKVSTIKAKQISHPYFEAFREVSKPVIGIDEATDFHLVDLLCMHSLADNEISSVTFSGDLMQRMTEVGLRNWQELGLFIPKFIEKKLLVSYRQSPTLLDVAQEIYQKATGKTSEYLSFMDKDDDEPMPLIYVNNEESESIEWIANRILEINRAYDNKIPSIAIFLPNEDLLDAFAKKLGNIDRLADVGIKVKACNKGQMLPDPNTVRVFSIEYIKGLEFEAVFFHNINQIYMTSDGDLILKNLYVGLSRATFYLGITAQREMPEFDFLKPHFDNFKLDWKI